MVAKYIFTLISICIFNLQVLAQKEKDIFLFSFFQENGEDGLHLAYSYNGLTWEALNNNQGFNVIDGTLVKENGKYILFLKDETRHPAEKNIRVATSDRLTDGYSEASEPITGDYWAEGPTPVKIGENWVVYFDKYIENKMGAVRSSDLENWEDISDQIHFPEGTRHGTVFKVPKKIFEKLLKIAP